MRQQVRIRRHYLCHLILFCFLLLIGCTKKQDTSKTEPILLWKNGQATGLSIPLSLLNDVAKDKISEALQVQLVTSGPKTAILGEFQLVKDAVTFEPLIPFTGGLRYEVVLNTNTLATIEIPRSKDTPALSGIYPSQDTLPENLLKFYFVFSRPMTEGRALQYITLLDEKGDALPQTFLNLQPELWNAERTILTLWLDPGRIKRDLQPNKRLGAPLAQGGRYRLVVSAEWPDEQGAYLAQNYTKDFVVTDRDMTSPKTTDWTINDPLRGTLNPLEVELHESLDYILLQNAVHLTNEKGTAIEGTIQLSDEERKLSFTPLSPWTGSRYTLQIEARLEDLAGNNLNRLFDRDLNDSKTLPSDYKIIELNRQIR
ncbi:MAG: Ig-like domain-containing protein [Spirosomataceae bacterium]